MKLRFKGDLDELEAGIGLLSVDLGLELAKRRHPCGGQAHRGPASKPG